MSTSLVKSKSTSSVNRKSLIQLASETPLRDPSAFARQRVTSLDNNARITNEKKRQYIKQIEKEKEELFHIDKQLGILQNKYNNLCTSLIGIVISCERCSYTPLKYKNGCVCVLKNIFTYTHVCRQKRGSR